MEYRINLQGVKDKEELHQRIEKALPLPAYYGGGLDGLYDVLTDWAAAVDLLIITDGECRENLGAYFETFSGMLADAAEENHNLLIEWLE